MSAMITDITVRPGVLSIRLDLLLVPGHPEYGAASPRRRTTIAFSPVPELHRTGQGVVEPAVAASGSPGFGSVGTLTRDGDAYALPDGLGTMLLMPSTPSLAVEIHEARKWLCAARDHVSSPHRPDGRHGLLRPPAGPPRKMSRQRLSVRGRVAARDDQ
ncbi:hypothetical protein ACIRG8_25365 [Streptomyces sp. NPDC102359]|uniref:hypothetical protein n=1 Tax=unclassified Streptomyces TaxID=2593676 RepID=UPI00381B1411